MNPYANPKADSEGFRLLSGIAIAATVFVAFMAVVGGIDMAQQAKIRMDSDEAADALIEQARNTLLLIAQMVKEDDRKQRAFDAALRVSGLRKAAVVEQMDAERLERVLSA